jgi:hypothetical protein
VLILRHLIIFFEAITFFSRIMVAINWSSDNESKPVNKSDIISTASSISGSLSGNTKHLHYGICHPPRNVEMSLCVFYLEQLPGVDGQILDQINGKRSMKRTDWNPGDGRKLSFS